MNCIRCNKKKAILGKSSCNKCLEYAKYKAREFRIKQRANGLCQDCMIKVKQGHVLCAKHLEMRKNTSRKNVKLLKEECFKVYGKKCSWPNCKITDHDMLTLDHIKDNGAKERKQKRRLGIVLFGHLKKKGWPKGYQTLCGNHQLKKELMRRRKEVLPAAITQWR